MCNPIVNKPKPKVEPPKDEQPTEEPKEEKAPAGVNKVDDVGAAFDELFND